MVMRRNQVAAVLLVPLLAVAGACGADSDETPTGSASTAPSTPADTSSEVPGTEPAAGSGSGSDAEAYAKVVMSTNMSEVFEGYTVDGTTIRFTTAPGATLDDAQCQYLKLSNSALRQSAGLTVLVVTDGTEVPC